MKPRVEPGDVVRFRDLIRARTGMAFPEKRSLDLERAIRRATAEAGLPSASALYHLVASSPGVSVTFDGLISALNVSETHFFRDAAQIEDLRTSILPELVTRRSRDHRLRLWSAGCSTGEEPYTLAILLRQLVPDLSDWDVLILATDLNGVSLERARRGIYRQWSFRGIPASMLGRHVLRKGDMFEIEPTIRQMVTFERLNLAEPVYPSVSTNTYEVDLILCRNVLLYFDPAQARAVVGRLWASLAKEGLLLVSRVDASLPVFEGFPTDRPGTGVFKKPQRGQPEGDEHRERPPAALPPPDSRVRRLSPPSAGHRKSPARRKTAPATAPSVSVRSARPQEDVPEGGQKAVPADPRAAYEAVLDAWRSAGVPEARDLSERALSNNPLDAPLQYLQGLILLEERDLAGALRAFRRSTYADPAFAPGHLGQGTAFARAGHRDRARIALETAARLVADLDPQGAVFTADGLTAAEILELVAAERALLDSAKVGESVHG
jgi:chemotaxis protein methyltransferase CheR